MMEKEELKNFTFEETGELTLDVSWSSIMVRFLGENCSS
jgi:hypothetical protein